MFMTLFFPVIFLVCFQRLLATPWIVAHQVPLSMEFFRQEYWSGLLFPTPGDLLDPGLEPRSLASPALAGRFFTAMPPGKPGLVYSLFTWLRQVLVMACRWCL